MVRRNGSTFSITNIKPGMVETHFSITRYRGDRDKAKAVYQGLQPLTAADVAETIAFAASVPDHIQIAEILLMPTRQATATIVDRGN
jgi:NADP-dependent 3-hydroxy acid dehydrogenase YdfG